MCELLAETKEWMTHSTSPSHEIGGTWWCQGLQETSQIELVHVRVAWVAITTQDAAERRGGHWENPFRRTVVVRVVGLYIVKQAEPGVGPVAGEMLEHVAKVVR
jgi:hypothetical protein